MMSPERAVEIIENLVDGIHPLTGEILPESNICEETGIVDALNCAIQVLHERIVAERAIEEYRRQQEKKLNDTNKWNETTKPKRLGKPWTTEEDLLLKELFIKGANVAMMMKSLERSERGVLFRLEHLELIDDAEQYPEKRKRRSRFSNEELRQRYLDGETIAQLGKRYGRSEEAIRARLFYMGLGGSGPHLLPDRNKDK